MPDEDKTFSGSLVLDLRIWWRPVHTHSIDGNRLFCQRPVRKHLKSIANVECQFANAAKLQNTGPLLPLHAYQLFLVLLSTVEPNKPLNMCTQNLMPYGVFLILSSTRHTTYSLFFHPCAIQRIPRSFIHCRAKRKSILDIGSRIDWHISVGELTFNISKSTSYVGKLVVAKTTEKLINDLQTHQPHKVRDKQSQQKDPWLHQQHNHEKTQLQRIGKLHCRNQQVQIYRHPRILSIHQPRPPKQSTRLRLHLWQHYHQRKKNYNPC